MREPKSRTLPGLVREMAERGPERIAIVSRGEHVSYGEWADRATRLATHLAAEGLGPGDRVGVLLNNRREWLELLVATGACGSVLVPFSTWSTRNELEFLLRDSGVRGLVALESLGERDFRGDLEALRRSRAVDGLEWVRFVDERGDASSPAGPSPDLARPEEPMVILYTSGSSARPKAVPLCHGSAIENGFQIGERMGLGEPDSVLVPVPLFWSYGCINALPAIVTHGATLVLQEMFEPEGALALIEEHRCTALYTLPAITNALLAHPSFRSERTASLRTGLTIGTSEDVRRAAEELGAHEICNIYGSTETYGNCCVTPHDWSLARRRSSQGPPLPGVTIRVRDPESAELLPPEVVGEIEVHGQLTPGYIGDSAQHNARVFTEDGYFRTGDLGSIDASGSLCFAGRSNEMIKRSGINVSPAEVEEALQRHPDVHMAGVTGTPDARWDEAIVAFVVAAPGSELAPDGLLEHCRGLLSRYKLPDHIELCDALPLTPTGKLMRRELRRLAGAVERA